MSLFSAKPLLTFNDGGKLYLVSARDLIRIPVWRGNRILDPDHKDYLQTQIGDDISNLDRQPYHCATFKVFDEVERATLLKTELLDGQHRSRILNEHFQKNPDAPDFQVMLCNFDCNTESDVIERFKILNTTKPIAWKEDPRISVGPYLAALETVFNANRKNNLIRRPVQGGGFVYRPYLSLDTLRDAMVHRRIGIQMKQTPSEFANRVKAWNDAQVAELQKVGGHSKQMERALQVGFILAQDKTFRWLDEVLAVVPQVAPDLTWDDI